MKKDFDKWNRKKKEANTEEPRLYTVREIWWCRLGVNIGSEQDGSGHLSLRPVIIVRAFGPHTCLVVPLTASKRKHLLRVPIGKVQRKSATALLSQIRVIDTRRLVEKVGFMNVEAFAQLRKTLRELL